MTDVLDIARAWLAQDPDAETRAELETLIEAGDLAVLHDRFDHRLEFGTAGLRGRIEAGSNRMNRVLVAQAAAGLAAYLRSTVDGTPSIVIGYDGRKNSRVFATDTAEIMAAAGIRTTLLPRMLPTPVLAFAVRHLDSSAGVMVTASHNPGHDNGYKVYLGGDSHGSQIVAPADAEIAAEIERIATDANVLELPRSTTYDVAGSDLLDAYVDQTAALVTAPAAPLPFVYTAMHGVGWETASRVFDAAGFGTPTVVAAQIEPDPTFPTVTFPNPEEPGALDLAIATTIEAGAELVIANDPDADRLAVAIPDSNGHWHRLSGNEVGNLLGWRAADRLAAAGPEGTLAASVVSSPALAEIASQYGLEYVDTLTGFKWISRVPGLSYGFEEALGYLVDPAKVRDKDGISAALDFLGLVADLAADGKSLDRHRLDFAERFGAYVSSQISIRVTDLSRISAVMRSLRADPPEILGSRKVRRMDDFADGFGALPPSDILRLWLDDGSRVIVRPSGTEPKLKVYIDASSAVGTAAERQSAAQQAVDELDAAIRPLLDAAG
ncbi:phospho-sugar mutase [soil metagenome]